MYPHPLLPCDATYYIPVRYDGTICGYSLAIYSQLDDDRAIVAYEIETPYFVKPITFVITNHQGPLQLFTALYHSCYFNEFTDLMFIRKLWDYFFPRQPFDVRYNLHVEYTDENDYAVNCLARVHFLNCYAVPDELDFLFERPIR